MCLVMETLSLPLLLWPELAATISCFYQFVDYTLEKRLLAARVLFHQRHSEIPPQGDIITENQKKESERKR